MAKYLRQNTAVVITVGPFLDATDGITPETALTPTNCHIVMTKDDDDGTAVNTIIDTTLTALLGDNDLVHIAHGLYSLELTAAQTNYLGRVELAIFDEANHCPVFHSFMILPAQVYDSLILGTDLLQVDVEAIDNDAPAAANLNAACDNYSATRGLAGTALPAAAADAAGGLPISDAGGLDLDAQKADVTAILRDTGFDGVLLADAAITRAKFDETTAFALRQADVTDSALARTGPGVGLTLFSLGDKCDTLLAGVDLNDDAITAGKFDESTAFPLKQADSAATAVARTGADSDTLETLSDEIAAVQSSVSGFATGSLAQLDDSINATLDAINDALDKGVAYVTPEDAQPVSTKLFSTLFEEVRMVLRDKGANQYKNELMVPLCNRALEEINYVLMGLSAEVAMGHATIVGDGTNQDHALPSDFRAFVPKQVLPRSPISSTTAYAHGVALEHVDQHHPSIVELATQVADPTRFCIVTDATNQYMRFNCIPRSGNRYDALYYRVPTVITEGTASAVKTPWLGLLDPLIGRTLELYCREGLEFNQEARAVWRMRAEADAAMLLGLRHLQTHRADPSAWKGLPGRR